MAQLPRKLLGRLAPHATLSLLLWMTMSADAAPQLGDKFTFTTTDGREVKNATLRRVEPDGITFQTDDGYEKIPHAKLPPELAPHFVFSEEAFTRYRAEQLARQKILAARAETAAQQRAAQEKAAAAAAATPVPTPVVPGRAEPRLGERGAAALGAPQLGGRSLGK